MQNKFPKVYAFIDSQNLNLGVSKSIKKNGKLIYKGWELDFNKFRKYLLYKFCVERAILFIGYIPKYKNLYNNLKKDGFEIVYKPVVLNSDKKYKGNIDAELVLHCCRIEYDRYDRAIIVSGDGDFFCIHKFLLEEKKLGKIIIPNSKSESSLLREFKRYKVYLEYEKEKLEFKKVGGVHTLSRR
ncbi:MAG TPA: NYN domain-containing protein [Candidatus Dojkabacteria bacterium]|nr:NYN domain-containing protein [Candidatus Dojkabacteria bacterium]